MSKRSKQKKTREAKARPASGKPLDRPAKPHLHAAQPGRPARPNVKFLRQGRGR